LGSAPENDPTLPVEASKRQFATLLRAQTTFVCIELSTGKPKRMPAEFIEGYGPAIQTPESA
jgi:acyl-CoA thioesterase FadM